MQLLTGERCIYLAFLGSIYCLMGVFRIVDEFVLCIVDAHGRKQYVTQLEI
jgi:hypothetical protein